MDNIYSKYPKKKELSKSISFPLFNINDKGKTYNQNLKIDSKNINNNITSSDSIKIQMMEEYLKRLQKEKNQQEEQINALMSYKYNNNLNNNGLALTSKNIFCPLNYTSELDKYYNNLDNEINIGKYYSLSKTHKEQKEKKKLKKYKENMNNLKDLLEKERMKKRINRSLYDNLYLNIKKDMNNFFGEINKSFQKKLKKDEEMNNNINEIHNNYDEIKYILNKRISELEDKQKKGFEIIQNDLINQIRYIKDKERLKNIKIKKRIKEDLINQIKKDNIKYQNKLDIFRRKLEFEDMENKKIMEEIKFQKLKKDILSQRNLRKKPKIIKQYQMPFMYPYNFNYL